MQFRFIQTIQGCKQHSSVRYRQFVDNEIFVHKDSVLNEFIFDSVNESEKLLSE